MKNLASAVIATLIIFIIFGGCGPKDGPEPNVRVQPGIERCGEMCQIFEDMNCVGYYEDLPIDCDSDPVYKDFEICENGGMAMLNCTAWCEYEMRNSVQLNPGCLADNLATCDEIETICN